MECNESELAFMTVAEAHLLRCLAAWDAIETELPHKQRLLMEASLLLKTLIIVARDGLHYRDPMAWAKAMVENWHDKKPPPLIN